MTLATAKELDEILGFLRETGHEYLGAEVATRLLERAISDIAAPIRQAHERLKGSRSAWKELLDAVEKQLHATCATAPVS